MIAIVMPGQVEYWLSGRTGAGRGADPVLNKQRDGGGDTSGDCRSDWRSVTIHSGPRLVTTSAGASTACLRSGPEWGVTG